MAQEMAGLGFKFIELSHGIRITLVPGILKACAEGLVEISSTHNFCPLPTGVMHAAPNLFQPSSRSSREIDQWLRHTKRSIDFAAQVGAGVLVCHLGSVEFSWFDPARKLRAYADRHAGSDLASDKKYLALLAKSLARLRERMPPFWNQTKASIAAVCGHAKEKGVKLGFENRERFNELPLDADYGDFLAELPFETPAGYWHDTGHADLKEKMGVLNHREHLEKMAPWLIGFHLHDVDEAGHDHRGVGAGKIDFGMISEFWRPEHRLVLEFSPRISVDDVRRSKERIEALMNGPTN
ncbi:MAG: Xylose isomerase domain protein barrel [Verrucomicrobia bacterium]|nr:Xylose isomerase domain protein barrel [Verrucomicrobiota bacterium]